HWGDWHACTENLRRGHAHSLAAYLAEHPGDFRGALTRLRPELRGLYLSAYQSHLWNRLLARWLQTHVPPHHLIKLRLRLGPMPAPRTLDDAQRRELESLRLPLPSAREK